VGCARSGLATRCTGVSVMTIVPIFPTLVGSGRTKGLLLAAAWITETHGWLLWDTRAAVLTATVVFVAVVERALLLSGDVDAAWGLLADGHAELINVQVGAALQPGCWPGSSWFPAWRVCGTKVCKRVTVRRDQRASSTAVIPYPCRKARTAV
jgi:hypothetical protein